MISAEQFFGKHAYLQFGVDVTLTNAARHWTLEPTAPGLVVFMPSDFQNGPLFGGPVWSFYNAGGDDVQIVFAHAAFFLPANETVTVVMNRTGDMPILPYAVRFSMFDFRGVVAGGGEPGSGPPSERIDANYYRISTGLWTALPNLPLRRAEGCAASFGGDLYLATARTATAQIDRLRAGTWSTSAAVLQSSRSRGLAVCPGDYICFFGGSANQAERLSPPTEVCVALGRPPANREYGNGLNLTGYNRALLKAGTPALLAPVAYHGPSDTYEHLTFPSGPDRKSSSGFLHNGRAWLCGGRSQDEATIYTDCDRYDPASKTWSVGTALPAGRYEAAGFQINERGFVVGGRDAANVNSAAMYRLTGDTWGADTAYPVATSYFANQAGFAVIP